MRLELAMPGEETVRMLREAIGVSPENVPLRRALGEALMSLGRYEEAEGELKRAVAMSPVDSGTKVALATAYYLQEKNSHAMVIVEELLKGGGGSGPNARVLVLHAKLLLRAGETDYAVRQYKRAVAEDAAVEDRDFAARLGISSSADAGRASDEVFEGKIRQGAMEAEETEPREVERPKIAFKDVGGMEDLKQQIRMKIIHPLQHPELYKAYGKAAGGGILMYGPPGCGKTHLARATAGEVKAGFLSVGINDVLNMWLGNSEKNLHEVFAQARRNRPCVLFFDEVDALAASRVDMRTSAGRHLINQFLSELDGVSADNTGVLILAATNAPWHVDPAFRRPGRFDRILFVPPPDAEARASVLRIMLTGKPVEEIDFAYVAKKTDGFSGADLKGVVDVAIERKLEQAMKEGIPKPISQKDLVAAAGELRPSTREWFATARNYALYSNQGGAYDDVLKYLKL
ncbi:MAG TPA: AAA family ATPase [Phycisphaerae bacterium]|nr:AAA family ATPase [Phycisphaerae bacterium]